MSWSNRREEARLVDGLDLSHEKLTKKKTQNINIRLINAAVYKQITSWRHLKEVKLVERSVTENLVTMMQYFTTVCNTFYL